MEKNQRRRKLADVVQISARDLHTGVSSQDISTGFPHAKSQGICVASGKGGTGKTIFSTNIGVLLSQAGLKVTLVDADLGLANSHLLLGLEPQLDVSQLIAGERSIDEVLVEGPSGLKVLPGGSGIAELSELNEGQLGYFASQMTKLEEETDITLVDCSAGITQQVLRFLASAHKIIVVTTPEVTSMIDGYAVIKNVHRIKPEMPIWLVVNRIKYKDDAKEVFRKMKEVVNKRLGNVNMELLGSVPHDRYVLRSVMMRQPVTKLHPRSFATSCFVEMSKRMISVHKKWKQNQKNADRAEPSYFWTLSGRTA